MRKSIILSPLNGLRGLRVKALRRCNASPVLINLQTPRGGYIYINSLPMSKTHVSCWNFFCFNSNSCTAAPHRTGKDVARVCDICGSATCLKFLGSLIRVR